MSLFNMKFSEQAMYEQLGSMLMPDEKIIAAVYASFREAGLFRGTVEVGYFGLTDRERLIGVRHSFGGSSTFTSYIGVLKKLRVKKGLLGARTVEYDDGYYHLSIVMTPKVGTGVDMPHQQENFQTIVSALEPRQTV